MTIRYSKCQNSLKKRLVYQQTTPNENISQKADDNLAKVSETVKESYGARLEMKDKLDKMVEPISEEKQAWEKKIEQLRDELKINPTQKEAQGNFECLGKTVTVVVTANGEALPPHQSYVDGKLLEEGFISWALKTKKEQIEKPNA